MTTATGTRTLEVILLDPFGVIADQGTFELRVPIGGSKDEATDDQAGGAAVGEFIAKYASAMAGGGLAFTVKTAFIDGGPERGAHASA